MVLKLTCYWQLVVAAKIASAKSIVSSGYDTPLDLELPLNSNPLFQIIPLSCLLLEISN